MANSIGYASAGTLLVISISKGGEVVITIDTRGVGGLYPLQKPATLSVGIAPEHLSTIQQWFQNIDITKGVTYVDSEVLSLSNTERLPEGNPPVPRK